MVEPEPVGTCKGPSLGDDKDAQTIGALAMVVVLNPTHYSNACGIPWELSVLAIWQSLELTSWPACIHSLIEPQLECC